MHSFLVTISLSNLISIPNADSLQPFLMVIDFHNHMKIQFLFLRINPNQFISIFMLLPQS